MLIISRMDRAIITKEMHSLRGLASYRHYMVTTRGLFKDNSVPNFIGNGSKIFKRLQKASHQFSLHPPIYKGCSLIVQQQKDSLGKSNERTLVSDLEILAQKW